jgi:hypothetical protein
MNSELTTWGWMGGAFAVALGLAASVLTVHGVDANGIGAALRLTARWSFLLFWMAYTGKALGVLFGPSCARIAKRSRDFGLAFAAAHIIHLGLVFGLYWITSRLPLPPGLFIFFGFGVFWTYLLAGLSFGGLANAMGPIAWRLIRLLGMNYILLAFANDFVLSVVHSGVTNLGISRFVEYVPFAALTAAAPVLCLVAAARRQLAAREAVA